MKKLRAIFTTIILAVAAFAIAPQALAQKSENTFGVQTGFTSKNTSIIAGLFYQYGLSDRIRITPEVGCVFRHKDLDAFTMDANVHYCVPISDEGSMQIYPLAGLNFSSWNLIKVVENDIDDVSTRSSKFGLNIGAGYQMKLSNTLKLKAEMKYTITVKYSTFVIGVGIGYVF